MEWVPTILGGIVGAVGAVALAPAALGALGFTTGGIAAGSIASWMMSFAAVANGGGVMAGGWVAVLQSVGAAGLSSATMAKVGATGALFGAAAVATVKAAGASLIMSSGASGGGEATSSIVAFLQSVGAISPPRTETTLFGAVGAAGKAVSEWIGSLV